MALKKWMSGKHWGKRAERKQAQRKARRAEAKRVIRRATQGGTDGRP